MNVRKIEFEIIEEKHNDTSETAPLNEGVNWETAEEIASDCYGVEDLQKEGNISVPNINMIGIVIFRMFLYLVVV